MPRARQHLTLEAVWDLEDQYTALAGSASGRTAVASHAPATAVPLAKTVAPKKITRVEKVVHAVTKGIKTGLGKTGIYNVKVKTHGMGGVKKPKLAPAAQSKAKVR